MKALEDLTQHCKSDNEALEKIDKFIKEINEYGRAYHGDVSEPMLDNNIKLIVDAYKDGLMVGAMMEKFSKDHNRILQSK